MGVIDFDTHFWRSPLAEHARARQEAGTLPVRLIRLDSPAHVAVDPATPDLVLALVLASRGGARWSWDGAAPNVASARLPGQVGVTPPGAVGRFEIDGPSSVLIVALPLPRLAARLQHEVTVPRDFGALHDAYCDRPRIRSLCLRLWKAARTPSFRRDLEVDALCETLVMELSQEGSAAAGPLHERGLGPAEMRRVVHRAQAADADVEALAATLAMPLRTFRRRFKVSFGMSPQQWLIRQRIEKACTLLRTTNLSLCELAVELGFAHQAHFSEAFVRATGLTPGRFRVGSPASTRAATPRRRR